VKPGRGKVRKNIHKNVRKNAARTANQKTANQKTRGPKGQPLAGLIAGPASAATAMIAADAGPDAGPDGAAHDQLMLLMAALRRALVAGRIAQIPALSQRVGEAMQRYLGDNEGPPPDPAELAALRREANANARCLEATLAGLRAARRRLAEIHRMHRSLGYDRDGRSRLISAPQTLARRM
jgi:hypothetical protein